MTNLVTRASWLLRPHARAEQLIDDRLDEEELSSSDAAWLEQHLSGCPRCQAFEAQRDKLFTSLDSLKGETVSEGFAGRVLMAAKARGREEALPLQEEKESFGWARGLAAAAAVVLVGVFVAVNMGGPTTKSSIEISGSGHKIAQTPHFTVRAIGIQGAKARSQVTTIVTAHNGSIDESSEGSLIARVPRDRLLKVMQDLARNGRFKMTKSDAGELMPSTESILIRFELE